MKVKNREYLKDLLESQIKYDISEGDTTVLAEIISTFTDAEIFNLLSDDNQEEAKHKEPTTNVEEETNVSFYIATYEAEESDEQPYKEVIAVFVDEIEGVVNGEKHFSSYAHLGQHCTCSQSFLRENCKKATEIEYKDLFNELENVVGYNLNIV